MKGPVSTSYTNGIPVFQTVLETAQGGFTLDDTAVAAGTLLKAGTLISFDETTRKAKVGKIAVLQANATNSATAYRVLKGHGLVVGMSITLPSGTPRAITAITTTDPTYDELTVGTTIGVAATAGDSIYVNDIGATAPKGLLYMDVEVGVNTDLAVVIRGTAYENRIQPVAASVKALIPNIIFSKSF